jgi:hypothetical protein
MNNFMSLFMSRSTDSVEQALKKANVNTKVEPTPVFASMISGANEELLVNSGLEYSMIKACNVSIHWRPVP